MILRQGGRYNSLFTATQSGQIMKKVPLKEIIVWKHRNIPGRRKIPRHLKLAILSRANIVLPTTNILWMVEKLHKQGVTWPGRLQRELQDIFPEVHVTVELFQNQKPPMSNDTIGGYARLYLRANRVPYIPNCYLIHHTFEHTSRKWLENKLDYDMDTLFKKPRVRMDSNNSRRYWLLVYACLPTALLNKYVRPEKFALPPKPKQPMPPIEAMTSASAQRGIRTKPSTDNQELGTMVGDEVLMTVHTKKKKGRNIWYRVELLQDMNHTNGKLAKGMQFWMGGGVYSKKSDGGWLFPKKKEINYSVVGFSRQTVAWDFFRYQLIEYEKSNSSLSIEERITKLRQMSHNKSVPFDFTIGVKPGSGKLYLNEIENVDNEWQMFLDYDSVKTPDGQIVDIHHLIVGLDALMRKDRTCYYNGKTYYGKSWSAATWAGDVGSAVSDMQNKVDPLWEGNNKNADNQTRIEFYFSSRASSHDLLADIDAWGINQLRNNNSTIYDLVTSYYSHTLNINDTTVISSRKYALERFMAYYGFHYNAQTDYTYELNFLSNQHKAREGIENHIGAFAYIWNVRKNFLGGKEKNKVDKQIRVDMSYQFLEWLEAQAIINMVSVQK